MLSKLIVGHHKHVSRAVRSLSPIASSPWFTAVPQARQFYSNNPNRGSFRSSSGSSGNVGIWMSGSAVMLASCLMWSSERTTSTQCEENASSPSAVTGVPHHDDTEYQPVPNPVWPSGICEADVKALVDDCLADPSINISAIPDYLERKIYHSTVKLTLNAVYETLGDLHGTDVLGHELRVVRTADAKKDTSGGKDAVHREFRLAQLREGIAEDVLERVVDGLLANKAVNQPLIPDMLERQLYKNCLVIMFRLLDMMAATFSITCCGHDLRFTVEPSKNDVFHQAAVSQASQIDPQLMLQYARQMGIDATDVDSDRSFWDRFFRPAQTEVVAQLHATLYSLVLGILDDVLAHTEIRLLSDTLQFDLVPVPLAIQEQRKAAAAAAAAAHAADKEQEDSSPEEEEHGSVALPFATFTAGLGVGITIMSLLAKKRS